MKRINTSSKFGKIKEAYTKTEFSNIFYLKLKSPLEVQIELTSGCNQKCIFCYNVWKEGCTRKTTENNLSKEEHLEVMDILIKNEVFEIIFSGGEPLLVPHLEELIQKLADNNVGSTIITNGTLLIKDRALSLKKAGLKNLQISLHHFSEEKNNEVVGDKYTFRKTVEGIKNAVEVFGGESVNVNMVALPQTYKDVYEMASFINSLGAKSFSVGSPSVTGEMANLKDEMVIGKEKFLDVYEQLKRAEKDFGIMVSFTGGFPLCILPDYEKDVNMISNYCDAGLNQLVISPEGNLRPCVCLSKNLGNILKDDLQEVWKKNKFLLNLRRLKFSPDRCKECKYLALCRGGCRASAQGYSGKINAIDPLLN